MSNATHETQQQANMEPLLSNKGNDKETLPENKSNENETLPSNEATKIQLWKDDRNKKRLQQRAFAKSRTIDCIKLNSNGTDVGIKCIMSSSP